MIDWFLSNFIRAQNWLNLEINLSLELYIAINLYFAINTGSYFVQHSRMRVNIFIIRIELKLFTTIIAISQSQMISLCPFLIPPELEF